MHRGVLVPKHSVQRERPRRSDLAAPLISRMEPYESPIDGKEVTSWGQRERELRDNNAYDPRDVSAPYPKSDKRPRKAPQ
jgi:hypothetical protein